VTGTATFRGDRFLIQARFAHALEKSRHQLGGLVGHVCFDPISRQVRLLASYHQEMRARFIDAPGLRETRASQAMRALKPLPYPRCFRRVLERLLVSASHIVAHGDCAEVQRQHRVERTEPDSSFSVLDRLPIPTRKTQSMSKVGMGGCRIRIDLDRAPECSNAYFCPFFHQRPIAERDMCPRVPIIERDRAHRMLAAQNKIAAAICPPHVSRKHQAKGEQATSGRVIRIGVDGALQLVHCLLAIVLRHSPEVRLCARDKLPGAEIVRLTRQRPHTFRGQKIRLNGRGHAVGDFILNREDFVDVAIVALGPMVRTARGVDELGADA